MASILPGYTKQHEGLKEIFVDGLKNLTECLDAHVQALMDDAAGYYAIIRSPQNVTTCKRVAVAIEEQWPWNRLLDIDCFGGGMVLTRQSLQMPERKCLMCENTHPYCIYYKRHSLEDLVESAISLISLRKIPTLPGDNKSLVNYPALK